MRQKLFGVLLLIGFIAFSIFFIDRPLAIFAYNNLGFLYEPARIFTNFCDAIFQNPALIWACSLLVGSVLFIVGKNRKYAIAFFTVILINIASLFLSNHVKLATDRARPMYFFQNQDTADFFNEHVEGDSFPSGHAAGYWSIFLPLAFVFRRYAILLLIIPILISISRMVQNYHYLSDVLASFVLVWGVNAIFQEFVQRYISGWSCNLSSKT